MYELKREQHINNTLEEVWNFFSSPENLSKITPGNMSFKITSAPYKGQIYTGQIISYKVSPILGIPLTWVTEIKDVVVQKQFVDEQIKGPYKLWRHTHIFTENDNGVLMKDIVQYEPPLSILGAIANSIFIKRQLEDIFNYRKHVIDKIFNN